MAIRLRKSVRTPLREDGSGDMLVIPFLLFAATFLTLFSVYYLSYSSSMNTMGNQMEIIAMQTEASEATGASVWANENIVYGDSVRIPINDLKMLRDTYGDASDLYRVSTFFVWRETLTLFEVMIDHDMDIHADNQLTVNITVYSENEYHADGANWQDFEAPGYIHVGKTWFETYALHPGDLSGNLLSYIDKYTGTWPTTSIKYITTGWPTNVEILVSGIARQVGVQTGSIDKIWGEVTLDWGTYAGSIGEIGWVHTLGDLLTCNLPGTPSMVRVVFAVPILLCVGYIVALFVKQVFFSL